MKICKYCGQEITSPRRRSFCSEACAVGANRLQCRMRYKKDESLKENPVKCMNCGKEFIRKQHKQKYCNWKCQRSMGLEEKKLNYKINKIATEHNFEIKNMDKVIRAKKMLFNAENIHRCPCDAQNPERYCGSLLCINDTITQGHCHCNMFHKKNTLQNT